MSASDRAPPLIFLIAGEPSGDALGAVLMAALKARSEVSFAGIGGPLMAAEGLTSLFPMKELTVMGLAEVLPLIPAMLRRIAGTVAEIRSLRPAALVTIDSPGFNLRVASRLKGAGIPLVHYVAPSVWAWRPGRARKIAGFLDHLLAILPFEPPYFEAVGLPCTFVGHPVLESGAGDGDGPGFRRRHGIAPEAPLIVALPGSRASETGPLLPVFGQALTLLEGRHPGLRAVVPTTDALGGEVEAAVRDWPVPGLVLRRGKFDAFAAADAALAASGTVALELAMARTPAVIAYKVNPVSAFLARRLLRVPYVSLVNLILDRRAVPEYLQEDCRPERLADALDGLLADEGARLAQANAAGEALDRLGLGGPSPSGRAADAVLDLIGRSS
ncbi:MAG: lipid-A-disaccharide synthase [Proteobacteria bacterium]|nr:lipid-A-disaccharide synthase [Pseudomonadota bacterium]